MTSRVNVGDGVEVLKIDGETLPFADDEFDVVFSATVLMHNVDATVEALVGEMCRVASRRVVLYEEVSGTRRDRYSYVKRTPGEYRGDVPVARVRP